MFLGEKGRLYLPHFMMEPKLIVDGTLNLGGELRINRIDGAPVSPGTFQIFEADAIAGAFDTITLPTFPGLTWETDNLARLYTRVEPGDE